ncbi:MAG TPA: sigma-70 family RNA polymerase sigma factor [Acidimicrobiales bacterium]|nr:sigma-70 family RNA polymerase sigma factor [Acidimicrobiales bacterium]
MGEGPADRLSDEGLLAGVALGDGQCAAAFVRRFQARVYGLALGIVSDRALAEDVAQEAFLRSWRHAGAFDPRKGSVAGWLLAITRNLAIDKLRLRRADPADPEALLGLAGADPRRQPDELAVGADDASRLRAAISELPPDQRRALVLAVFQGRTAQEVAEAEGIPLGTAKTRIRAAMSKLRVALVDGEAAWA